MNVDVFYQLTSLHKKEYILFILNPKKEEEK